MAEFRVCIGCRNFIGKRGLRGPGCGRTAVTLIDPVLGPYENMRRCSSERSDQGRLRDRLFRPERLPCGPEGRYFEPKA